MSLKYLIDDQHSLGYEPKQAFPFQAAAGYTDAKALDPVVLGSDGKVSLAGDGVAVHGLVEKVRSYPNGQPSVLTVSIFGSRAEVALASAAIAAGEYVVSAGSRKFRPYNSGGGDTPQEIVGLALTGASADGEKFEVVYK